MGALSLSVRVDAGVVEHNNRKFVAKNVKADKISDNIIYVQKDLKQVYKETFDEALEKYNFKQKRSDRIITDYYEHIKNSNQEKLFYEAVIQFGNADNSAVGTQGGELAKQMLDDYMMEFQKRNPNFIVFNAVMHLDEATPHLHIDFVPVAHNQSRGLETRVSLKKALEETGISGTSKKESDRQQWALKEKEIMKSIAKKHGLEIENKNIHRPHLTVEEYKYTQDRLKAAQKKVKELYEKSEISSKKFNPEEITLLANSSKQLQKEVDEKEKRIRDLQEKISSDFRYIKIGDEQKINFVADELRKEGISVVDDLDGIHIPEYAVDNAREIAKKYKPVAMSWRKELALTIDRLIYKSRDLDQLLDLLKMKGYIVRKGKYISIKPANIPDARAVRTKTLGDDYTEDNLIKRITEKDIFNQINDEKINKSFGAEKEFLIQVKRTIILIYSGDKKPKKFSEVKPYSINNDWHINQLAMMIDFINRNNITSSAQLESLIAKNTDSILQTQNEINDINDFQIGMRDVITKAEFYFENKDKKGDSMFNIKLAAAKEVLDKYNLKSIDDIKPLKKKYSENVKALSMLTQQLKELQALQSKYLKLQETYQQITSGNYLKNVTETKKL